MRRVSHCAMVLAVFVGLALECRWTPWVRYHPNDPELVFAYLRAPIWASIEGARIDFSEVVLDLLVILLFTASAGFAFEWMGRRLRRPLPDR